MTSGMEETAPNLPFYISSMSMYTLGGEREREKKWRSEGRLCRKKNKM